MATNNKPCTKVFVVSRTCVHFMVAMVTDLHCYMSVNEDEAAFPTVWIAVRIETGHHGNCEVDTSPSNH